MSNIDPSAVLYRRLIIESHIKKTGRVSSNAFKRYGVPDNSISVDLASMTSPDESVNMDGEPNRALCQFSLSVATSSGFRIRHDPQLNTNPHPNLAHHVLDGNNDQFKCSELAKQAEIIPRVVSLGTEQQWYDRAFKAFSITWEMDQQAST